MSTKIKATKETKEVHTIKGLFVDINRTDLLMFTRELKTVLESGLDIISGLNMMKLQTQKKAFNDILDDILLSLKKGHPLSKSLSSFAWLFNSVYIGLIRAGEYNGDLPGALRNLEYLLEREIAMKRRISQAMIYPSTAFFICVVFTFITFKYLLPSMLEFLTSSGNALPLPTVILISITKFMTYPWTPPALIGAALAIVLLFKSYTNMPKGRYAFHKFLMAFPFIGTLLKKIAYINITNTLATLLSSGVALSRAVKLAGETSGNAVFELSCSQAVDSISEGVPLSVFIKKNPELYGKMFASMLAIGEEAGSVPEIAEKLTELYEVDVSNDLAAIGVVIEPVLIAVTGLIIGFVMVGVFLPLYSTISNLG